MAELRIYHGKTEGIEPPRQLVREGIEAASEATPSPAFCAAEIVHHSQVEHYRSDFGSDTKGQSAVALCYPDTNDNISPSNVTQKTVEQIETELRNRLGAGYLAVLSVDESLRVESDGTPRTLPESLE